MAALAALGRTWVPAGGLFRQVHRTSIPLRWSHAKVQLLSHPHSQNCRRLPFWRPPIRCQSTAAVAGAQVAQAGPPPPSPAENVLPIEDLSQALQEPTLAELGLGSFSPVGLILKILESFHLDFGLPWWGAIVAGTVVARSLVFPLIVKGQREAILLNNHLPRMNSMTTKLNEAKKSGNKQQLLKAYSDLSDYQKRHNINPLRGFIVPLVQGPIFISFFLALRKMAELPVPGLETGGLWWFLNLTTPDPYYLLPLMVTVSMWAVLELGVEAGVSNPNFQMMKTIFRVIPVVLLPITINFPTAIFTYWLTSNIFSLVQVSILRLPVARTFFRLPERVAHDPNLLPPAEGFVKGVKKRFEDAKLTRQMEEREWRIKHHLDLAAKGPLRQTFSHNPLQQSQLPPSKPPPKQRPWEDTLG